MVMTSVVARLLADRTAWMAVPGLAELLELAARQYLALLRVIPKKDLRAKKYEVHMPDTPQPDDGIFYKYPKRKDDPSAITHGVVPDHKTYVQVRARTRRLLMLLGLYCPESEAFFDTMDEIRRRIDVHIHALREALYESRPDLGRLRIRVGETVIRCMVYHGARPDDPKMSGKGHTDKADITLHLYDSAPGLLVRLNDETNEMTLVPTSRGQAFAFLSDHLAQPLGCKAVYHGARNRRGRAIIVAFPYFQHPSECP